MNKYEEALERAKELHESGNALTKRQMEIVFPELKESEDERVRKMLIEIVNITPSTLAIENRSELLSYLERQKEKKMPVPEYCGENKRYPTEYCLDQDTRKKLIELVEKSGQEEDKEEMLDYLETYQPVQSASEVKEYNFQPGDPDEKAIKRLKEMIYYACDESSDVPPDEACALDDWLDDKCKPVEWSEEDETMLERCISKMANIIPVPGKHGLEDMSFEKHTDEELVIWLNSLPKRFELQQKQEVVDRTVFDRIADILRWCDLPIGCPVENFKESESEREHLLNIVQCVAHRYANSCTYCKEYSRGYKDGLAVHHWKPSEEQMDALSEVIGDERMEDTAACEKKAEILESLYNDLKKL